MDDKQIYRITVTIGYRLKINRPISSSFKVTVILVTFLQRNFDKIDEKFTYTMYGSKRNERLNSENSNPSRNEFLVLN